MAKLTYQRNKGRRCSNCRIAPAYSKGRCRPCYDFWRAHGFDRPEPVIIRHGLRILAEDA